MHEGQQHGSHRKWRISGSEYVSWFFTYGLLLGRAEIGHFLGAGLPSFGVALFLLQFLLYKWTCGSARSA